MEEGENRSGDTCTHLHANKRSVNESRKNRETKKQNKKKKQ